MKRIVRFFCKHDKTGMLSRLTMIFSITIGGIIAFLIVSKITTIIAWILLAIIIGCNIGWTIFFIIYIILSCIYGDES